MINTREAEIRDASLALAVTAYEVISNLKASVPLARRVAILEGSFNLSSLIAEAFSTSLPANSEEHLEKAYKNLLALRSTGSALRSSCADKAISLDKFLIEAKALESELTDLLASINKSNAESYSPKLETTCF